VSKGEGCSMFLVERERVDTTKSNTKRKTKVFIPGVFLLKFLIPRKI
jgi:hypothetical protein